MNGLGRGTRGRGTVSLLLLAGAAVLAVTGPASADLDAPTDLGGEEVTTSTDAGNPTAVVAGVWTTELGGPGSLPHQFSYTRTMPDSTVHLGVSASGAGSFEGLALEAFDEQNSSCGSRTVSAPSSAPWAVFGARLSVGPQDLDDRESSCLLADVLRFSVGRTNTSDEATDSLPVTVRVIEEAPLARGTGGELPETFEEAPAFEAPEADGEPEEVTGSTTVADAPEVGTGRYELTLAEGEERLLRVPLEWGQSIAVRAVLPPVELGEGRFGGPDVSIGVLDPLVTGTSGDLDGADSEVTVQGVPTADEGEPSEAEVRAATVEATTGTWPVRYRHRFDGEPSYLPGDHYVALRVEGPTGDAEPLDVPVELTIDVRGEVAGEPEYTEDDPFLVADGRRTGDVTGVGDGQAWRLWVALGLGAFGVACVVLGGLRLRRR